MTLQPKQYFVRLEVNNIVVNNALMTIPYSHTLGVKSLCVAVDGHGDHDN